MYKAILATIKREVGAKCTYLAFVEDRGQYFFQANLINDSGAKDKVKIEINEKPELLEEKDYAELTQILKTRSYATS